jgi:adenylate cyclase
MAVLPVVNLSTDPEQECLADAMTDALITELTNIRGLQVLSRTSSMAYKGRRNALPVIAEELGVEWILLGSVARAGGQVRVTAQLVDAATDENRWAHSYTRRPRNILSMQSEVAEAITRDVENALASNTHRKRPTM